MRSSPRQRSTTQQEHQPSSVAASFPRHDQQLSVNRSSICASDPPAPPDIVMVSSACEPSQVNALRSSNRCSPDPTRDRRHSPSGRNTMKQSSHPSQVNACVPRTIPVTSATRNGSSVMFNAEPSQVMSPQIQQEHHRRHARTASPSNRRHARAAHPASNRIRRARTEKPSRYNIRPAVTVSSPAPPLMMSFEFMDVA